jgi:hypothetical protein
MDTPANVQIKYYSLFCGVFLFEESPVNMAKGVNDRLKRFGDKTNFLEYLKKNYYENYLSNILSDMSPATGARHLSITNGAMPIALTANESTLQLVIPYIDVFLFQSGVGVFAIKVEIANPQDATYFTIQSTIHQFRNPQSQVDWEAKKVSVVNFLKQQLERVLTLKGNWDQYIPQLKSYTIIEDFSSSVFTESLNRVLFELAHILPPNSSPQSTSSHSQEYYAQIQKENTINIFSNWKAISLFDTFTRISCSYPDNFKTWERDYFLIYVHCLYTKFQLYHFNNELKDLVVVSQYTKKLKNRFIEFVNDYNLAYISYKFLPNLVYEKINQSLEIQKELDSMETKIGRIHESNQEKKSRQMNTLLLLISLLSILSVITDLSQWLTAMGLPEQIVYSPVVPFFLIGFLVIILVWIFKRR